MTTRPRTAFSAMATTASSEDALLQAFSSVSIDPLSTQNETLMASPNSSQRHVARKTIGIEVHLDCPHCANGDRPRNHHVGCFAISLHGYEPKVAYVKWLVNYNEVIPEHGISVAIPATLQSVNWDATSEGGYISPTFYATEMFYAEKSMTRVDDLPTDEDGHLDADVEVICQEWYLPTEVFENCTLFQSHGPETEYRVELNLAAAIPKLDGTLKGSLEFTASVTGCNYEPYNTTNDIICLPFKSESTLDAKSTFGINSLQQLLSQTTINSEAKLCPVPKEDIEYDFRQRTQERSFYRRRRPKIEPLSQISAFGSNQGGDVNMDVSEELNVDAQEVNFNDDDGDAVMG